MQSSCIFKTSDGKRKAKGKKKPVAIKDARKRRDALLRKLVG